MLPTGQSFDQSFIYNTYAIIVVNCKSFSVVVYITNYIKLIYSCKLCIDFKPFEVRVICFDEKRECDSDGKVHAYVARYRRVRQYYDRIAASH